MDNSAKQVVLCLVPKVHFNQMPLYLYLSKSLNAEYFYNVVLLLLLK